MNNVNENQLDFLDFLVVLAENIRLLIFGPLVFGGLAFGVALYLPQSYVSHALLSIPSAAYAPTRSLPQTSSLPTGHVVSTLVSPQVVDAVIATLNLADGRSHEVAKLELLSQIKINKNRDDSISLAVTANTPIKAQAIANAVVDCWIKTMLLNEHERILLEKRLEHATAALNFANRVMSRLTAEPASKVPSGAGELAMAIAAIGDLQSRYLTDIHDIKRQLEGPSRNDFIMQSPSLPTSSVAPKRAVIALMVMLTTGFMLVLWVFVRKAWRDAAHDSVAAEKLARLRAVFGLKKRHLD
jgi:uncharacterized protein involved in exopolysaccharide biosynthesis